MTDVLDVFGKVPMQASLIERCEHRETFSLVGRAHELGYWSEGDSRMPKLENTRMCHGMCEMTDKMCVVTARCEQ